MYLKTLQLFITVIFMIFANHLFCQINKDIRIKLSTGIYGLEEPSREYVDEYNFKISPNYSIGLVKDFKINNSGNWLLRSEVLYNRTHIKVGLERLSPAPDAIDRFKLDQLLFPLKLTFSKNGLSLFTGLITNFNFSTQKKEEGDLDFEQVGTYNIDDKSILFKNTFVDRTIAIQYVFGADYEWKKGRFIGLEFVDYVGFKNYYEKYFGNSYNIQQIAQVL